MDAGTAQAIATLMLVSEGGYYPVARLPPADWAALEAGGVVRQATLAGFQMVYLIPQAIQLLPDANVAPEAEAVTGEDHSRA
jgi:hypothetical protein